MWPSTSVSVAIARFRRLCPLLFALAAGALAVRAGAASRPRYGGTLRIEMRATVRSLDPREPSPTGDASGRARLAPLVFEGLARLDDAGRPDLALAAHEAHWEGRPFLDAVTVEMGRATKDSLLDLEVGKADFVEIGPAEVRRAAERRARIWSSAPLELLAVVFDRTRPELEHSGLRQALALAIDRTAIQTVLLQKQGEVTGALVPQWVTGYAFLLPPS